MTIAVECAPAGDGWRCQVRVGDDPHATTHQVDVARQDLERLRPGDAEPDALVRDSFAFLLEREPRESILRRFALPEIGRYFPEWESTISG